MGSQLGRYAHPRHHQTASGGYVRRRKTNPAPAAGGTGLLLREHVRQKRGWYRIQPEDHSQQTPFRVVQLLGRAGRVDTQVGILCNLIYSQQGEVGVRRILGVLSLAKKYGTAAVDEACAAALEMGVHDYRFVRRYLERCPQAPSVCARSIP